MSVLDPKSARAKMLAFIVLEPLHATPALAAQLASYRREPAEWSIPWQPLVIPRNDRIRASYALAWLRRSGMVRKGLASFEDGRVVAMVEIPANVGIAPQYLVWEPTEYGRAVLRSMLAAVPEPA